MWRGVSGLGAPIPEGGGAEKTTASDLRKLRASLRAYQRWPHSSLNGTRRTHAHDDVVCACPTRSIDFNRDFDFVLKLLPLPQYPTPAQTVDSQPPSDSACAMAAVHPIFAAISRGNEGAVKRYVLADPAVLEDKGPELMTPLVYAIRHREPTVARWLLEHRGQHDVNTPDRYRWTGTR